MVFMFGEQRLPFIYIDLYTLAANVMESLLLNDICDNLIGIYCFWSYVQLRNEILLISSIHNVTKLNGQTQSVLSGDRWDSREKSEFRGSHLKWSLPNHYHFDAFMQRRVSVKTIDISKGDHATKFARANTATNCQVVGRWQFSARSSQDAGLSQGCISKILRCNRETSQPHQRKRGSSMKISMPWEDCQLLQMSERTASSRLLVCECRRSADLGGGCQFEPFGDSFWLPDIGLGVQPDVLGAVWSTGDAAVSGGGGTECEISDNGDTVSSVMSPGSPYTTVTVGSGGP